MCYRCGVTSGCHANDVTFYRDLRGKFKTFSRLLSSGDFDEFVMLLQSEY